MRKKTLCGETDLSSPRLRAMKPFVGSGCGSDKRQAEDDSRTALQLSHKKKRWQTSDMCILKQIELRYRR